MARLSDPTVLMNPETGEAETLLAGTELPQWAEGKVGEHLLEASDEESVEGSYADFTNDELREEIADRNLVRPEDDQLSDKGRKSDLISELERDDSER